MLKTSNTVGFFFHVERKSGELFDTRNDLTIFVPHNGDWSCTLEGSPDKPGRCFIFKNTEELIRVISGLQVALTEIEKRNDPHGDAMPPGWYYDQFVRGKSEAE